MKRILSYLIPIRLKEYHSEINGDLEINLVNGKRLLDTSSSNYSYGSLQKILHRGLQEIGITDATKKILVLGLGGGSIIQTIRETFHSDAEIVIVDIDKEIIAIAINEFHVDRFKNIRIIQADALQYIESCTDLFDIIIVDLFVIDTIPEVFTQPQFLRPLCHRLKANGKIIYNTIRETMPPEVFHKIEAKFIKNELHTKILRRVEQTNDLILAKRHSLNTEATCVAH